MAAIDFTAIGRLATAGDNVAIATCSLAAGTEFVFGDRTHRLSHAILEGHRFAVEPIPAGGILRSWGLPFGKALRTIQPGEYLCNAGILDALRLRNLDFPLPALANFQDFVADFHLDEKTFRPGKQVPLHAQPASFEGYARAGGRGVGTRNFIIILGTTSQTASFARALAERLRNEAGAYANIDGIVAVAHTEGGGSQRPNNIEFVLRTLAGFMVHANVGAVLAVDYGTEAITNVMLEEFLRAHDYPLDDVLHRFYSVQGTYHSALDESAGILRSWLAPVNTARRVSQPLSGLKIALQCGGSDAFSGVSGNPLAGWVAREVIMHGGSANLAETDELIGAEPYILANTRDLETARRFLEKIEIFKERVAWHGHSAEGNPSGGNKFRGLYNLALKSIGAARKKDPEVQLDYVIDYSEPMERAGFYFMDSPGNDLESIAGQVAAGCNMIFFTTGNGSITNFPFVPTIKIITTTGRWTLLSKDMDVNAGRYQDGTPMDELGMETFGYTVRVASGMRTVGERAGHSQVSIWRDWQQTDRTRLRALSSRPRPTGKPIAIRGAPASNARFHAWRTGSAIAIDQVGLIVPTSLCSGQIALRIAKRLNASSLTDGRKIARFVALPHTEGCGASSGENEDHLMRLLAGHLLHPFVKEALLLEHGCERTHNDMLRHVLRQFGIDPERFGFASVQLDGGIDRVVDKVEQWFEKKVIAELPAERCEVGLEALSLGLLSVGEPSAGTAQSLAQVIAAIVGSGGTVVIPDNACLLESADFRTALGLRGVPEPSLDFGQMAGRTPGRAGLHIMAAPTRHSVETLAGLGATGVQLILAHVSDHPLQGHPLIPTLQVATYTQGARAFHKDLDYVIHSAEQAPARIFRELLQLLCDTASSIHQPRLWAAGYTDFQVTRGELGVSL